MKFFNKAGRLTPYSLSCGYIETCKPKPETTLELWQYGGGTGYQIRATGPTGRIFWETETTLTTARKRYDRAVKELA